MPTYQFEAMDQTGQPHKGVIEAPSGDDAISRIKSQGYFPTSVREKKVRRKDEALEAKSKKQAASKPAKKGGGFSFGRVNKKVLTTFTRQLSTLQDAGLPILRSLQILTEQQKPGRLKNVLSDVQSEVEGGAALSDAMAKHPKVFDRLYTKMIAAGEVGGVLEVILQRLADFMEKAQRLKRKIIGAMIYPIAVISVACLILTGIMVFVIPKFEEIFQDFDVELPGLTQWLIDTSKWMAGTKPGMWMPGAIWVLLSPFIFIAVVKLIKTTAKGKAFVDYIKLRIPLVGKLMRISAVARFTRTLGTLINAGVPILEAILITRDTVGNYVYEKALQRVHDSIREGETFAVPLRESRVVDPIVVNMVDVGEETGDLDKMLEKIADNYDDEVDVAVGALVSLMEPLMVVFLGGAVGTIVVALFMPMVKLIEGVSG